MPPVGRPDMPLHSEPEIPENSPIVLAHVIAEALRELANNYHEHRWDILEVTQPESPHPRIRSLETIVLLRCQQCNLPETMTLDGLWTLDQIRAKMNEPINE